MNVVDKIICEIIEDLGSSFSIVSNLSREYLQLSKLNSIRPGTVDLNELCRNCCKAISNQSFREVVFDCKLDPSIGSLSADAAMMENLILNLIENSLNAMDNKGTISIHTYLSEKLEGCDKAGIQSYVNLELRDSGKGFPPELEDKIFEAGFSLSEGGTGLGLAICHRIVTLHKGKMRIQSVQNKGTVVTISLPLANPELDM